MLIFASAKQKMSDMKQVYTIKDVQNARKGKITMRHIFAALVQELGQAEGAGVFEWYCSIYKVNATSPAPASVVREVFGI